MNPAASLLRLITGRHHPDPLATAVAEMELATHDLAELTDRVIAVTRKLQPPATPEDESRGS